MIDPSTLQTISILLQSTLVAGVIVAVVFAWRWLKVSLMRGEIEAQNGALMQLAAYARVFVAAAEQTMTKAPGFAKMDWVLAQFDDVLPDLDKNLIRNYVEAAVAQLPKDPPKTLKLAAPAAPATTTTGTAGYVATAPTFTGTPSSPPPVAPPVTSHSHKHSKTKVGTEG